MCRTIPARTFLRQPGSCPMRSFLTAAVAACVVASLPAAARAADPAKAYFDAHCASCHDAASKAGNFDITTLKLTLTDPDNFAKWVKVYDRIAAGEMPPKRKPKPPAADTTVVTKTNHDSLIAAEQKQLAGAGRTGLRRLTRVEYENTVRDLLDLPGIPLQGDL